MDEVDGVGPSNAIILEDLGDFSKLAFIGYIPGGSSGSTEEMVEILFNACDGVEDSVGFWEDFFRAGHLSVREVGNGHGACKESVLLVLSCLQSCCISVKCWGRWCLWHDHPRRCRRLGCWLVIG